MNVCDTISTEFLLFSLIYRRVIVGTVSTLVLGWPGQSQDLYLIEIL